MSKKFKAEIFDPKSVSSKGPKGPSLGEDSGIHLNDDISGVALSSTITTGNKKRGRLLVVAAIMGVLCVLAPMCGDSDKNQGSILKSAQKKVDEGRASYLTPDEADALGAHNRAKADAHTAKIERQVRNARSGFSAEEIAIYEFMKSQWTALSETASGYNPDVHDDMVATKASKRFGVTKEEAGEIFLKIDLAGLRLNLKD